MTIAYNTSPISNGLGFLVDFSNSKCLSGLDAYDISRNKMGITLSNPSANTVDIIDGYANFNPPDISSTASFYTISNGYFASIKNETSFECAMYPYGVIASSQNCRGVSTRVSETGAQFGFAHSGTSLSTEINTSGGWLTSGTGALSDLSYNKWVIICQTTSASENTFKTYVNGILRNTVSLAGNSINSSGGFLLGRGFYGGIRNFDGRVGYLKVYNRKLEANEVAINFEAIRRRYAL